MGYPLEPERSPDEPYEIETKDKIDPSLVSVAGEEWRLLYDATGRVTSAVIFTGGRESGRLAFHYDVAGHISQIDKSGSFSEKTLFLVLDAVYANAVILGALPNPYPVLVGNWPLTYAATQSGLWDVSVNNFPAGFNVLNWPLTYAAVQSGIWDVSVNNFPAGFNVNNWPANYAINNFPATYDVSDRAARWLGIVYGNLGQKDQIAVGGRNLATQDLRSVTGTALTARDWTRDLRMISPQGYTNLAQTYSVVGIAAAIGNGAFGYPLYLRNGATGKDMIILAWSSGCLGNTGWHTISPMFNPTTTANGAALTIVNDRGGVVPSGTVLNAYQAPTVTVVGTMLWLGYGAYNYRMDHSQLPLILPASNDLLFRVYNASGAASDLTMSCSWIEVASSGY